jgi:hypothetical protein
MSLLVIIAVAVAIFVLAVVAVRVWVHRSRARPERPVSEAEGAGSRVAADTERPVGHSAAPARRTGPFGYVAVLSYAAGLRD